eukprot:Skav211253  [mRNA]  locus=scaffold3676:81543:83413:+ [translate_table: standard]
MGCDANGDNCALGGSGGPGQECTKKTPDYSSCAPPIDTKFEATWGRQGEACNPATNQMAGCDFIDVSLVDGFTLAFKLEVLAGTCTGRVSDVHTVDCSGLSVAECPTDDNLGHGPVNMQVPSWGRFQGILCGVNLAQSDLMGFKMVQEFKALRKALRVLSQIDRCRFISCEMD